MWLLTMMLTASDISRWRFVVPSFGQAAEPTIKKKKKMFCIIYSLVKFFSQQFNRSFLLIAFKLRIAWVSKFVAAMIYKQKILKIRQTIQNNIYKRHAIRTILIAYFRSFPTADKLRYIDRFDVLLWNRSVLHYIANTFLCSERLRSLKL